MAEDQRHDGTQADALTTREHLGHAHHHLVAAMDALDGPPPEPDAGDGPPPEPRGMGRFTAKGAQARAGFPAGSVAGRTYESMRRGQR